MLLNKHDVLRIVGHRMRKDKLEIIKEFLNRYQQDEKMSLAEWTRAFTIYMKWRE